jgi:hypothetical protein
MLFSQTEYSSNDSLMCVNRAYQQSINKYLSMMYMFIRIFVQDGLLLIIQIYLLVRVREGHLIRNGIIHDYLLYCNKQR